MEAMTSSVQHGVTIEIVHRDQLRPEDEPYVLARLDNCVLLAGDGHRWLQPSEDRSGATSWIQQHAAELAVLGLGRHTGTWTSSIAWCVDTPTRAEARRR